MPDLSEADLADYESRYVNKSDPDSWLLCELITEVRRLRAENAELRKLHQQFDALATEKKRVPELNEVPPEESLSVTALEDPTDDEAERQGAWAYSFGINRSANPYVAGSACEWWFDGWDDSEAGDEG